MSISISPVAARTPSAWSKYGPMVFFWACAVVVLFVGLGVRELWTAEDRWAEVARTMLLSGDVIHPRINGQDYFDKPLLGYWAIVVTAWLIGGLNEWAIRLPSAIAGLLALWATISLGRKLWNEETARLAGWLLLTCQSFIFWGRTGQADMANLAACMLAINWFWGRRDRPGFINAAVFYIICLLGAQFKGLAAVAVPCLAVAPYILREKRWHFLLTWRHGAALLLGLAIYAVPFVIESASRGSASGLALVFRENIQRYFNPFDHRGAFYIYVYDLPLCFLPWALIFLLALPACLPRLRKLDGPSQWLIAATVLAFLFFTASGSRRSYYILPLIPFCALLTARWLTGETQSKLKSAALRLTAAVFILMAFVELLSPLLWLLVNRRIGISLPGSFLPSCVIIGALALMCWVVSRYRPAAIMQLVGVPAKVAPLLVMAVILLGGYFCRQQLLLEEFRSTKAFAQTVREKGSAADQFAFYKFNYATLSYYMSFPESIVIMKDPVTITGFLERAPGLNLLIIAREDFDRLQEILPEGMKPEILIKEGVFPDRESGRRKEMLAVALPKRKTS